MRTVIRRNRSWLLALIVILLLSIGALFVPGLSAANAAANATAHAVDNVPVGFPASPNAQILNDDLDVEAGTVYEEDVVVYDGDVTVRDGGIIRGDLVVYSGDVVIEEGGLVDGDVSAFSGDIEIQGRVGGNLASWSGDIKLEDSASVAGDISVLSGDVKREAGAYVGGNIVQGPSLKLPSAVPPLTFGPQGMAPDGAGMDANGMDGRGGPGLFGSIGRFLGRLFGALFLAVIFGVLATGVTLVKPKWVDQIERTIREETALSFIVGLLANIALFFLSVVLVITLCLWPIPLLALAFINILGWTGIARIVGRYVSRLLHLSLQPALMTGLGALTLLGGMAPFWAMGGCLRVIVWLVALVLGAIGTGAFLLPWLNRWRAGELSVSTFTGGKPSVPAPADAMADAGPVTVVPPASAAGPPVRPGEDDLTAINGIGPVFDKRLKAAGIRTYAQLAAMTPEQIADVIGWPAERVVRSEIIEQARKLLDTE